MRARQARIDADRRLPVLLRLRRLRETPETAERRLLRVLFIRRYQVPTDSGGEQLLHVAEFQWPAPVGRQVVGLKPVTDPSLAIGELHGFESTYSSL